MKISLCQINLQAGNIQHNLTRAREALTEAISQGSQLALLPELWSSGYDLPNAVTQSQRTPEILAELAEISHQNNLIIGGSLLEYAESKVFNTFSLIQPAVPVSYRKIHLFRLADEHKWLSTGQQVAKLPLETFRLASVSAMICAFQSSTAFMPYPVRTSS